MKNKGLIVFLFFLFIISASASTIGYLQHNKAAIENKPTEEKTTISYEYYLDDDVEAKTKDEILAYLSSDNIQYSYSRHQCTNDLTGTYNNETLTIIPDVEKNSICKIYYVKNSYNVTLSLTNGIIDEEIVDGTKTVQREGDVQFKILPNEGYQYKSVSCSNDKEAIYDISTNTLTISSIMQDVACKLDFEIKTLKLDLKVKNGSGTTTETVTYGEKVTAIIKPNEGYEKPKIECTNGQKYIIDNNTFIIEKLTDNTKCTVTYSKAAVVMYKLKIATIPNEIQITYGSIEQNVQAGKDGTFALKAEDGYKIKLDCGGIIPTEQSQEDGSTLYTFLSIFRNITCNITAETNN